MLLFSQLQTIMEILELTQIMEINRLQIQILIFLSIKEILEVMEINQVKILKIQVRDILKKECGQFYTMGSKNQVNFTIFKERSFCVWTDGNKIK